jgi:hypothetical protein
MTSIFLPTVWLQSVLRTTVLLSPVRGLRGYTSLLPITEAEVLESSEVKLALKSFASLLQSSAAA